MRRIFFTISLLLVLFFLFPKGLAAYNTADFHNSSITPTTANSDRVPADGKTDAMLTVTVKDAYGTPLAGDTVSIVVTDDTSAIVAPDSNVLDSAGKSVFYVRSTKEGVDSLDIIDRTQNVTLPGIGHVTFYSTTCTDTAPAGSPTLLSAAPVSRSQIKLTWSKAPNPVTFYTVYYGTKKGVYTYGNPNVGGADTTSYTVGSLNIGITYFFVVIPGNGCRLGPVSNELSAKATSAPASSPTPTQKPVVTPTPTKNIATGGITEITPTPAQLNRPPKTAVAIATAGVLLLTSAALFIRSRR